VISHPTGSFVANLLFLTPTPFDDEAAAEEEEEEEEAIMAVLSRLVDETRCFLASAASAFRSPSASNFRRAKVAASGSPSSFSTIVLCVPLVLVVVVFVVLVVVRVAALSCSALTRRLLKRELDRVAIRTMV
jgi:hypothetical protein